MTIRSAKQQDLDHSGSECEHGIVTSHPTVSIIMSAANAAETISDALEAVAAQDYPSLIEVVVATADEPLAAEAAALGAIVVHNPGGRTPTGLNLAVARSRGEIVVRVDAHSVIPPGYVTGAVSALMDSGADNAGGMQVPVGISFWERAIATAMVSRIGAGDAKYRVGGAAGPTETVYLGTFRRSTFDRLGGYDEAFLRNQDYELNHRIRKAGGTVWFDPSLKVEYRPRGSLYALANQYFQYGQWKRRFAQVHRSLRLRQLAPPGLVVALAASAVGSMWWPWLGLLPLTYLVALVAAGVAALPRAGISAIGTPIALGTMHLSWGIGFLIGQRSER